MEEVSFNTEPPKNNNTNKKAIIAIVIGIIVFSIIIAVIVVAVDGESGEKTVDVSNTSLSADYTELLGYSASITGVAKNNTGRDLSYVQIEFSVYDSAGNNLGTAVANINNLGVGDTWRFDATLLSFPNTRPSSYKLADVTYF